MDGVRPGDPITVLGYPGVSPKVFFAGKSRDMLDPGGMTIVDIPVPTVTPGAIGKVIRGTVTYGRRRQRRLLQRSPIPIS
jgi:hypothetical protein